MQTAHGPALVHLDDVADQRAVLALGHGAGGGFHAPDLEVASDAARAAGIRVAQVEQPYRVAGRKTAAPTHQLDAAWLAVIEHLRANEIGDAPLISGGRSSGARVACRTAEETDAVAVLALAFPVHPPGKGDDPSKSRLGELDGVGAPVLVVQGESDPFGMPPEAAGREVVRLRGNHGLKSDLPGLRLALERWFAQVPSTQP